MPSTELHRALARALADSQRSRIPIERFSRRHPEMSMDDSDAIQREWMALEREAGRKGIGHKIGLTSRAMQIASQITEPDDPARRLRSRRHLPCRPRSARVELAQVRMSTTPSNAFMQDGEHNPNDLRSMLAASQASAPHPSHPVVRVPQGDTVLIKLVLEIGATTLLVPMVESAAQAREIVRAMRYPPRRVRGVGSGLSRSSRWNAQPAYLREADDRNSLLVQVETVSALAQVGEIAAVDGVEGVFIGPADLAASVGLLGQSGHADVRAAIEAALPKILAAGKAPGILTLDETLARHDIERGARFIAVGVEATLQAQATRALAARFGRGRTAVAGPRY